MRRTPGKTVVLGDGDPDVLAHAVFVCGGGRVDEEDGLRGGGIVELRMVCIGAILGRAAVNEDVLSTVYLRPAGVEGIVVVDRG